MMDKKIISIPDFLQRIRLSVDEAFPGGVWIEGEIRQLTRHASGHWYFRLFEQTAQIECVMWKGDNAQLGWSPDEGTIVEALVVPTVFEKTGSLKIVVRKMIPSGKGARALAFERLKKKLADEGLFDNSRKKPLPAFPMTVGVATSRTGAAIRDITNILNRRAPWVTIVLRDTRVQGDEAPNDIIAAIGDFERFGNVDLLIVGRGGGSEEDLWCFNDERLARKIASSSLPIISAVGHEIDFTIADFVADLRAPTPSAAAEIAAPDKNALAKKITSAQKALLNGIERMFLHKRRLITGLSHSVERRSPQNWIMDYRHKIDSISMKTSNSIDRLIAQKRAKIEKLTEMLSMLSYERILSRGFALVYKGDKIVPSAQLLNSDDKISIAFCDGNVGATVE
jgi:exodeoxyribonuclease VII large subunit